MVKISDHALLRYIERIVGLDTEGVREQLVGQLARGAGAAQQVGGGRYVIRHGGAGYVVVSGVVVTVLTHRMGAESIGLPAPGSQR